MKIVIDKNRQVAIILIIAYLFLLIYTIFEQINFFGPDIGIARTMQTSQLARAMFLDIGILSTLSAFWVITTGTSKYRRLFAIAIIFIGSFALLPYLIIEFWNGKIVVKKSLYR